MAPPAFPPPFIIERTRRLGFGTGPWSREQLVATWGAPTADKFIAEAKAAGWLISPSRGLYHVPTAQDIMVVSWLPEPMRSEFLIARTLAASNIRAWCLSAWCRDQGLLLADAVFVTDLAPADDVAAPSFDRKKLQTECALRASQRTTLPFLNHLLIVPAMPPLGAPRVRFARVPDGPTLRPPGGLEPRPASSDAAPAERRKPTASASSIAYTIDGAADDTWVAALLATIGTARMQELAITEPDPKEKARDATVQRWASLMGPPQPIATWKETLINGPFPFLLVPPSLWAEIGGDQAARRYRKLDQRTER